MRVPPDLLLVMIFVAWAAWTLVRSFKSAGQW